MSGTGVKCREYRFVKACERRRRIGRHLCKTCKSNENREHEYPESEEMSDSGPRLGLKEKCAGCKKELQCWTAYHDGVDCYE